ncbi:MAG: hypothetical protein ABW121_19000 [Candidatus Thiodiazotropha sp. 6PLUC7]|nr:hypothetical protein [Candidatus Thiodiazotropha lotti]
MKGRSKNNRKRPPGRPKGSKNRFSQKSAENLAKKVGMLPHEFLAELALSHSIKIDREEIKPTLNQRVNAAKAAAPYYAPKLHSVTLKEVDPREMSQEMILDELKEMQIELRKLLGEISSDPAS